MLATGEVTYACILSRVPELERMLLSRGFPFWVVSDAVEKAVEIGCQYLGTGRVDLIRERKNWLRFVAFRAAQTIYSRSDRSQVSIDSVVVAEEPGNEVEQEEDRARQRGRLLQALEALPPRQREIVTLHEMDDQSLREIAARLDVPVTTVRRELERGLQTLKSLLEEDIDE